WGPAGEVALNGVEQIVAHLVRSTAGISLTFIAQPASIAVDGHVATASSRVVAYLATDGQLIIACAQYSDRLRLDDGGWRMARRDAVGVWRTTLPLTMRDGRVLGG